MSLARTEASRTPRPRAARTLPARPALRAVESLLRGLLAVCSALLLAGGPAAAHTELLLAEPAPGEQLREAPARVELRFGAPVEAPFSPVEVLDARGERVDLDDAQLDPARGTLAVGLGDDLPPGEYRVVWHATSADGHPLSGEYAFTVEGSSPARAEPAGTAEGRESGAGEPDAAPVEPVPAASREGSGPPAAALLLAGLLLGGGALAGGFFLRRAGR